MAVQLPLQVQCVDLSKRYDVYCLEGTQTGIYRNAFFKSRKALFPRGDPDLTPEFVQLEPENGQAVFVACGLNREIL